MTLKKAYAISAVIIAFVALAFVFLGNQRLAFAQTVPVDGAEINCDIYNELNASGQWNPAFFPTFDASGCEDEEGENGGNGEVPPVPVDPCEDIFPGIPNMPEECDEDGGSGGEEPTDVCPNIEGVQTSVPEGKVLQDGECVDETTGGGGGSDPACSDGVDNDADGKTDMDDPGCLDAGDASEDDPVSGGGGGGGGGGGSGGSVLGTTTPVLSCDTYLTAFIKQGNSNDVEQVKRLQSVLKNFEMADLEENGEYDAKTLAAVLAFQSKYAGEILMPWGIEEPTGYVFLTTRKKINEIYCKNLKEFPLSEEERAHIESAKNVPATQSRSTIQAASASAAAPAVNAISDMDEKSSTSGVEKKETPVKGNRFTDFFRRLFDRFR